MANISSVKIRTQNPNRGLPIMLLSVGAVLMIIDSIGVRLLGAALAVTAIALFVIAKSSHFLVLTTAGGEVRALRSRDLNRVQAVLNAINEAIVARA